MRSSSFAQVAASVAMMPLVAQAAAAALEPAVIDLGYSKYVGVPATESNSITQWLGIRYAAPPVDDLRFRAPQEPLFHQGIQNASRLGPNCLGTGMAPTDAMGEDCLFLNVYAPTPTPVSSSPSSGCHKKPGLPVVVYLTSGGFNTDGHYGASGVGLVEAADQDLVVVFFSYRVGLWGFLATGEDDGTDPNAGLLDQRMVLHWVQRHIAKFGGDPSRVVIAGGSAGGASVTYHLSAYDGEDEGLFVGAAGESASFGPVATAAQARYQYVDLAQKAGCGGNSNAETLQCLRGKTAAEIQAVSASSIPYPPSLTATNSPTPGGPLFMWSPVIDGGLIKDLTYRRFAQGKYIKVPTIFGDVTNGGTIFAPTNTSSLAESNDFMRDQFPAITDAQLDILAALYPNPNTTGCASADSMGCWWRQAANVYGEMRYLCPSLFLGDLLQNATGASYTYLWDVHDPTMDAEGYGVEHIIETYALFGPDNFAPGDDAPKSYYYPDGINAAASPVIQGYWTSFFRTLNPNTYRAPGSAVWESWGTNGVQRLRFQTGGSTKMESIDSKLQHRCEYQKSIALDLMQ